MSGEDKMELNDRRMRWDVVAGAVMIGVAVLFLIYGAGLRFGSLRQMGPGFLPICTAVILGALGALIALEGLRGEPTVAEFPALRPLVVVVACPIVFALMIGPFGMVPTVVVTALLARMAEPLRWGWDLVLVPLTLVFIAVVVFIEFVGVAIPVF